MNKVKEFRENCENIKSPWNRIMYVYDFISEDLSIEQPRKSGFLSGFHKPKKSNTEIVIDDLERYLKLYNDFFIYGAILDSPNISSEEDYQKIFNMYIKDIKRIKNGKLDNTTIKVAEKFKDILRGKNLELFCQMYTETISEPVKILNGLLCDLQNDGTDYTKIYEFKELRENLIYDLMVPFFDLIQTISDNEKCKDYSGSGDKLIKLYSVVGKDIYSMLPYVDNFSMLFRIVFDDPRTSNGPSNCIDIYDYFVKMNIIPNANADLSNDQIFNKFAEGIRYGLLDNISWSEHEYRRFIDKCKDDSTRLPIAFTLIDIYKHKNSEVDKLFNQFLEKNREDYYLWCMCPEGDFFADKLSNRNIYTENDILTYKTINDELLNRQKAEGIKLIDFKTYRSGSTSTVTRIGDYIVKAGLRRYVEEIPNHRRILQPIIRKRNENAFLEVSDAVDSGVTQEEINQVFYELLKDGLAWTDAGMGNIGRLKRKNVPRHNIQKVSKRKDGITYSEYKGSSSERATNITGDTGSKPLKEGECVIIDTDLVYDLRKMSNEDFSRLRYPPYMTQQMIDDLKRRFEEIQNEKNNKHNKSDRQKNVEER